MSEAAESMPEEAAPPSGAPGKYPPYAPYSSRRAPPSVADTIVRGRGLRLTHKSVPAAPVRSPPKPAKPKGPKVSNVKMSKRALRAHARCLRRHGAVLTERLERMAKPPRRTIIYLWREYAHTLTPDTIARLRCMLDADEPFKPDQAYEYFINLRKTKKKAAANSRVNQIKRDMNIFCADKRFVWARDATVSFARGLQQRLARPCHYALADSMLRLSDIVLEELCCQARMRPPPRTSRHPKSRFMLEIADKLAVWIDEIISEADDRMLMMDFDEDDEVEQSIADVNSPPPASPSPAASPSATPTPATPTPATPTASTPASGGSDVTSAATSGATSAAPSGATSPTGSASLSPAQSKSKLPPPKLASSKSQLNLNFSYVDRAAGDGFAEDFLEMLGDKSSDLLKPLPAWMKFKGEMLEAFKILTAAMNKKGDQQLLSHGKFQQTYKEGADELMVAESFEADDYSLKILDKLKVDLASTAKPDTPAKIEPYMKEMVNICSQYLAQNAEYNKDKGPAFKLLVKTMKGEPGTHLYQKEKASRNYGEAAKELETSKGLETDHDDPNLSQEIHSKLSNLMQNVTPPELKTDMTETLDVCSKYLSQCAIDEIERGPAFEILIKALDKNAGEHFAADHPELDRKFAASYVLRSAPGFGSTPPDAATKDRFVKELQKAAGPHTMPEMKQEMQEVIERCAKYLSGFARDRQGVADKMIQALRGKPSKELEKRNDHTMTHSTGAQETEEAPYLVPFKPVKDIAKDVQEVIQAEVGPSTPADKKIPMTTVVRDTGKVLSQPVALKSNAVGERYPLDMLAGVMDSHGDQPLYKSNAYGQSFKDAAKDLKSSGPLTESDPDPDAEKLRKQIERDVRAAVEARVSPAIAAELLPTIMAAAAQIAAIGIKRGKALQHIIDLMKEKGDAPLANLQGYDQTFAEGAMRLEQADSLANDRVDKKGYELVKGKLTDIVAAKPNPALASYMPDMIDDSSKFLAAPSPETPEDKRKLLKELMGRKQSLILEQEGLYKITYKEGGKEIMKAPVGVTKAHDDSKQKQMSGKINEVIPGPKLKEILSQTAEEGAAYLVDTMRGRAEAIGHLDTELKGTTQDDYIQVKDFTWTHGEAAQEIETAPHFSKQTPLPHPELLRAGHRKLTMLPKDKATPHAKEHMSSTINLVNEHLGKVIQKKSGLGDDDFDMMRKGASTSGAETEEPKQRRQKKTTDGSGSGRVSPDMESAQRSQALGILVGALRGKGGESIHRQGDKDISHNNAADVITRDPPRVVESNVQNSGDTERLTKKFEKKMGTLVENNTPPELQDVMEDIVVESSRTLAEDVIQDYYKSLVRVGLISEMQKHKNEPLIEQNGNVEGFFFAAQRLKKAATLDNATPIVPVANQLRRKIDDALRCRSMARKLSGSLKEHVKDASDYLSDKVNTPDDQIAAFCALLDAMDEAGDTMLIEGPIQKSYKDCSSYVRTITSPTDPIGKANANLQSATENKLKALMSSAPPPQNPTMPGVITDTTRLIVSYIQQQIEKTAGLSELIALMNKSGDGVLLRHGNVKRTFADGANLLVGKNTDQMKMLKSDPVVVRKIQIKMENLLEKYKAEVKNLALMNECMEDATNYLAVNLLKPQLVSVCKCMKNVFVQCELWCDEILRRVARPCCKCSRQISAQDIADLSELPLTISPSHSRAYAPNVEIDFKQCPSKRPDADGTTHSCPSSKPSCKDAFYLSVVYGPEIDHLPSRSDESSRSMVEDEERCVKDKGSGSGAGFVPSSVPRSSAHRRDEREQTSYLTERDSRETQSPCTPSSSEWSWAGGGASGGGAGSGGGGGSSAESSRRSPYSRDHTAMMARIVRDNEMPVRQPKEGKALEATVSTQQMCDWRAMLASLVWNARAWRGWIHDTVRQVPDTEEAGEQWAAFRSRVLTEAMQWRQYNLFSRNLTLRLAHRYRGKMIVSPTRSTERTREFLSCQQEMLDIIDMFDRWTQWLAALVRETDHLPHDATTDVPAHVMRWNHFKTKVEEYSDDWLKYNMHLELYWESRYSSLVSGWLGASSSGAGVWVVSACGAVPSGAVCAGAAAGEAAWVARTAHDRRVLPAALTPRLHSCLLYADGERHRYTKYQVLCNAEVSWLSWRAGSPHSRAVPCSQRVYIGRVSHHGAHLLGPVLPPAYRCHVVIYDRPFAFAHYELLVYHDDVC